MAHPACRGAGLPDLDAARSAQPAEPAAPAAIPSEQACTDCTPCPTCGPGSANHAPVVSVGGPYYGTAATTTVFNGLGSFDVDPGDGISDYAWSFGDNTAVAHGATPSHTYQAAGNYTVSLTVTDRHSTTSVANTTASVTAAAAPTPSPSPGATQGNAAAFVSQSVPATMTAGQRYPVSVTMRNTGSSTWSAARLYRLGWHDPLNPLDNSGPWGKNRVYLPADTAPGAEVTLSFTLRAPYSGADEPPPVLFKWQMVQDGVQWFGDSTPNQVVTLISNYQPPNGDAPEVGPFSDLFASRIAPQHRTGKPGEDLLSGNYNWGLGLVDLSGRTGLNLNLALSYNSLATWTKVVPPYMPLMPPEYQQPTSWTFDADRGSPSPGFRLGFPSIQGPFGNFQAGGSSYLLLMPSGARVELRQVDWSNVYESVDSSYLQMLDGGNGSLLVRSADGSQLSYWSINSEYRCMEVKDRNGNYLTIKYDPINGVANLGRMTSIIDTLGRTINFNYDVNYRLQAITQLRNGQIHVWATFGYSNLEVQTNFVRANDEPGEEQAESVGVNVSGAGSNNGYAVGLRRDNIVPVLTQVGLDDGSRYNFDYTSWAQVYQIHHYAADGYELGYTAYDLPRDASEPQADCPRFTQRQDWAENWNNNEPAVTTFEFDGEGAWGQVTVAGGTTNQVSYREYSSKAYGDWFRGLVTSTEIRDNTNAVKKTTITAWERDFTGVPFAINPRAKRITISDSDGNRRQTSIEYTSFGLPAEVIEQGPLNTSDWTILRRTHTDYELSPTYVNRHILGLVRGQYLFAPDALNSPSVQTLMSKTTYEYDVDAGICDGLCADYVAAANSSTIVQHDGTTYGSGFIVGRGAMTRVRRWDSSDESNESKRITSSMHYNSLGSAIRSSDPLGHQTTIGYADQFSIDGSSVANPSVVTMAYPTVTTDPDGYSASARYNYDLGMVTRQQDPKGAAQTTQYDSAGRVKRVTNVVNGAYSRMVYPASQTILVSAATVNDLDHEAFSFSVFDGAGRVRATASDFPASTPHYRGKYTSYDILGRAVSQSNPIEITSDWTATGADAPAQGGYGWVFFTQSYDWKGRPLVSTHTDGTTSEASYGGCGCAGGEVVTLTDEGTISNGVPKKRQQIITSDSLGRAYKTEVLNWQGGSVYSATVNTFNVRDQVTLVRQYQGTENPNNVHQDSTMSYDGYGRLKTSHAPEQQVDPANSASTDHTTWDYNADDTVQQFTDARGATQTVSYNARRLVNGISYASPSGSGIPVPVAIELDYDSVGSRLWMTDGLGRVDYNYDTQSRMTSEVRHFTGLEAASTGGNYMLAYEYNVSGQLKKITDPFNAQVGYTRDSVGRVSAVTSAGFGNLTTYASNFQYRASGALKHLTYGNSQTLDATYNVRLQPTSFRALGEISMTYQRFADGRLSYTHDLIDQRFDRAYTYDHVGQLTQGLSGAEARGEPATNNRPYKENLSFDVWGNLTTRNVKHWRRNLPSSGGDYVDNRMNGWQYDADGRNTVSNSVTSTFDAAGRLTQTSGPQRRTNAPLVFTQGFDGDGRRIKKTEYTETTYLLRSSVLGGAVISEIYGTANQFFSQHQKGHVYVNGAELAEQNPFQGEAFYNPSDPSGVEQLSVLGTAQLEPLGNDVGDEDPYVPEEPDPGFSYPHMGDMTDPMGGCAAGMAYPCTSRLTWLPTFGMDQWRRLVDLRRTPSTFPTSEITLGTLVRDAIAHSPLGGLLFPKLDWSVINPTFFQSQRPYDPNRPVRNLSREEISSLIDDIFELFKSHHGCEGFINSLLAKMNSYTDFDAGNIENILEGFRTNGSASKYESVNSSGAAGVGAITISGGASKKMTAATALGEIIHSAGMVTIAPGEVIHFYADPAMAQAAYELGAVMSVDQYTKTYPEWAKKNPNIEGGLAHAAIEMTCTGEKSGVSLDHVKP